MLIPKAVAKFAKNMVSKEPSRYAIHGVHLEKFGDKFRAVATNGKMLATLTWKQKDIEDYPKVDGMDNPNEIPESTIVDIVDLVKVDRVFRKKLNEPIVDDYFLFTKNGSAQFAVCDFYGTHLVKFNEVEGHFPNVDEVIPNEGEEGTEQHFDVKLLTDMLGALKASGFDRVTIKMPEDDKKGMTFVGYSSEGEKDLEFKGVLMSLVKS